MGFKETLGKMIGIEEADETILWRRSKEKKPNSRRKK